MADGGNWQGSGWSTENGFLKSESSEALVNTQVLGDYGFHAEVLNVGDFQLILRGTAAGELRFQVKRERSAGSFVFAATGAGETLLKEWELGRSISGSDERALVQVETDAETFRVLLNGFKFLLIKEEADALLAASAASIPAAGTVGVLAGGVDERWAWMALSRGGTLRVPTASRLDWETPTAAGARPLMLHGLSAESGAAGDEVVITGEGFTARTRVEIGNRRQKSTQVSGGEIRFIVGEDTVTGPLTLSDPALAGSRTPPISFRVRLKPSITSIVPSTVQAGETFQIFGERFMHAGEPPEVRVGNSEPLEILRAGTTSLEVRAPRIPATIQDAELKIISDGMETVAEEKMAVQVWEFMDLVERAHLARWRNGRVGEEGILTFGKLRDVQEGAAALQERVRLEDGNVHDRVLYTAAPDPDYMLLDGFYPDEKIQVDSRLFVKFGFRHDARSTDGVKFSIHFYHRVKRSWYVIMPDVFKTFDGEIAAREIDLNDVLPLRDWSTKEGKPLSGAFSLRVEPGASGQDDHACWLDVRLGKA